MAARIKRFAGRAALAAFGILAHAQADATALPDENRTPVQGYEIVHAWPHDATAFTQGLVYADGKLYESTGRYGASSLRLVDLERGAILRKVDLPDRYFGEGIAVLGGKIFLLTWRSRKGFIYDRERFERIGEFRYEGQGWGLTTDGRSLIMSDGSNALRFLDPATFRVQRTVAVHDNGRPVANLNELEYIKGEIYANVWRRDVIARIDPASGEVRGWIDLSGLYIPEHPDAVANGIAYDAARERLFVTGKLWSRLFEIRLKPPGAGEAGAVSDDDRVR